MALTKIDFAPGLVKDDTSLAAEGGYVDADGVRFRQGKPETRGGCVSLPNSTFTGTSRKQHVWSDLLGRPQHAWATESKAFAYVGGQTVDITPNYTEGTLLNPFTTTTDSNVVVVMMPEHGLKTGDVPVFTNARTVAGLNLNGARTVQRVTDRNSFEITAGGNANAAVTGGSGVDYTVPLSAGVANGNGMAASLSVWSMDNFGETLLLSRRGGPLYGWQPAASYPEILLDNKFVGGTDWTTATRGGTKASGQTASNLSQNIQNVITAGATYRAIITVTGYSNVNGFLTLGINAGATSPAVIAVGTASTPIVGNGTYSRLFVMPADAIDFVLTGSEQFGGTVTVSLKLESKAFPILEAPRRIDSFFVDPHRTVCLFGTYEADGDYNPLLARWSAIDNYRVWIPDNNTFAGEISIASGGRIVRAMASRTTNLIWTDASLHGMQFGADGFSVGLISNGCGALGINAVTEFQGIAYWWSNDGNPYRTAFDFQGAAPQLIPCRIRAAVFNDLAVNQDEKVYASVNSEFGEVQWLFPLASIGTECNTAVVYNPEQGENHWTSWRTNRSSWVPAGVFPNPMAAGTNGKIYNEETGTTDDGAPLPNYLETAYFDIEDGGNLMQMMGLAWDFARLTAPIRFIIKSKLYPYGAETVSGPYPIRLSPLEGSYRDQKVDFRRTGRQMAIRIEGETPWRMGVLRALAQKSGAIR